jgi:hypothetical protein
MVRRSRGVRRRRGGKMNEIDLSIRWFSNFAGVVFGNWWRFCNIEGICFLVTIDCNEI